MRQKRIALCLLVCTFLTVTAQAVSFSDVPASHPYYTAIASLSEEGILNGYEDKTFRPDGTITRAEAAAVMVRAAGLSTSQGNSIYRDVPKDHWACPYIMAATRAGMVNGVGNETFSPGGSLTHNQILKMLVCMLGLEEEAIQGGGWPDGYVKTAYRNQIIDAATYSAVRYTIGSQPAARQDVAYYVYHARLVEESRAFRVEDGEFSLGMAADGLKTPEEVLPSTGGFQWYVYGTETYQDFYALGVDQNQIVALASAGLGFEYLGYRCGDVPAEDEPCLYTDGNDHDRVHSVLLLDAAYGRPSAPTGEQLLGESKMNFHFTNAFRVFHGLDPLRWSDKAAKSARLHSQDMADHNYFAHEGLDGSSPGSRMERQGIDWWGYGENIAAGNVRFLGFHAFDAWVNSAGHRSNMLGFHENLGVGIAYNPSSTYTYYHTQNFFSGR